MTAATKTVSASPMGRNASLDALAGPAMAAMMLPSTLMLGGIVTMCGFGFAFARAFGVSPRDPVVPAPAAAAPRLVVSNPPPVAVPAASVEAAKPAPAKPSAAPPKPTRPGGAPPKPKAMKAVSPKDAPAAPKVAAVKAAVAEVPAVAPVAAAKPVPAKPTGIPPKPSRPGGSPPKPKMATPSMPAPAAAAAPAKKLIPTAPKALTIATTSTAKGISLPKLSIQKNPGSEPGKD